MRSFVVPNLLFYDMNLSMINDLKKKIVVVTGSGNGIGKAIAEKFAENNGRVVLATIDETEGKRVEKELLEKGYQARFIQTDVRSEESVIQMLKQVKLLYGDTQILVNNAGITLFKSIFEATLEDWNLVLGTDLRGVFLCSKYMAQNLVNKNLPGSIINISSNHAYRTLPDAEMYAAAKGGVNAMTRSMALSLGRYGIRVNSVCPGFTDTHHYTEWLKEKKTPEEAHKQIESFHSTGHISTPEDIAHMVLFLASDLSKNITGADFLVDGGLTSKLYHLKI